MSWFSPGLTAAPPRDGVMGATDRPPEETPTARLEVTVVGRVQGVGFRYFARREAERLGLDGWVANAPGGMVQCVAEGPRGQLEKFRDCLLQGPPSSIVERVSEAWMPATGTLGRFTVRSGAHSGD